MCVKIRIFIHMKIRKSIRMSYQTFSHADGDTSERSTVSTNRFMPVRKYRWPSTYTAKQVSTHTHVSPALSPTLEQIYIRMKVCPSSVCMAASMRARCDVAVRHFPSTINTAAHTYVRVKVRTFVRIKILSLHFQALQPSRPH